MSRRTTEGTGTKLGQRLAGLLGASECTSSTSILLTLNLRQKLFWGEEQAVGECTRDTAGLYASEQGKGKLDLGWGKAEKDSSKMPIPQPPSC